MIEFVSHRLTVLINKLTEQFCHYTLADQPLYIRSTDKTVGLQRTLKTHLTNTEKRDVCLQCFFGDQLINPLIAPDIAVLRTVGK